LATSHNLLNGGNSELLERVILAMVSVNEWRGMDGLTPELSFHGETLHRLFNQEAIGRVVVILPATQQLNKINAQDTSTFVPPTGRKLQE
jgi:hypothetical protein